MLVFFSTSAENNIQSPCLQNDGIVLIFLSICLVLILAFIQSILNIKDKYSVVEEYSNEDEAKELDGNKKDEEIEKQYKVKSKTKKILYSLRIFIYFNIIFLIFSFLFAA